MTEKPKISLNNCEECPVCKNETLTKIPAISKCNGRMCPVCKSVVSRDGKIEVVGKVAE